MTAKTVNLASLGLTPAAQAAYGMTPADSAPASAPTTTPTAGNSYATVPDVPTSTATAATGTPISEVMSNTAFNPQLPNGGELVPITQQAQPNEMVDIAPIAKQTPIAQENAQAAQLGQASTVQNTPQVDPNAALSQINPSAGTYQSTQIGQNVPQSTAAQGVVNEKATVAGQLKQLYSEVAPGQTPEWAKGAVSKAEDILAARGLGASSIGAAAIAEAIQQSALPIAAQDASTFFQMDLTNLTNQQQTALENTRIRMQGLLSDQAADNASKQFNASSTAQTQQFMAQMVASISTSNADRKAAIEQFNAGQENTFKTTQAQLDTNVSQFNASLQSTIKQFNAQQDLAVEQFNANMQFAIQQSNTGWRRNINTQNTAAVNAANQVNTQNMFNLGATALNNLWQQYRDEASWLFTASENQKTRDFQLANAANNRSLAQPSWGEILGNFAGSIVKGAL